MGNKKILLVGGGGHCRSVLDCLLNMEAYDEIGIVERQSDNDSILLGVPVVGTDADLPTLFKDGWSNAVIALGSIGNPARRRALYETLKMISFTLPPIIDPSAVLGREVSVGEGTFIGKRAVINSGTQVGRCAIINTGAILEHDCSIGDFVHISPGCVLCGGVAVGENTHVGAGTVVRQQIQIGHDSLIGAGSVVVKDIAEHIKAFGNPCRMVEIV